eukprot:3264104-Prymnesium_polylepis.1
MLVWAGSRQLSSCSLNGLIPLQQAPRVVGRTLAARVVVEGQARRSLAAVAELDAVVELLIEARGGIGDLLDNGAHHPALGRLPAKEQQLAYERIVKCLRL